MQLSITVEGENAKDFGYLVHKHPDKVQSFSISAGKVHVYFPEATEERQTVCLLLDVDSVGLVRRKFGSNREAGTLFQYVNDRPYVASSFMSVAIADVFGSAFVGNCKTKPELVDKELSLEAFLPSLPCRGGVGFLKKLFEPLGYEVTVETYLLDSKFKDWGESSILSVKLKKCVRLKELLTHLYVLIPVLDNDKHYWVGEDEVEKLLRRGEGWLSSHPEKEAIVNRFLKFQRKLTFPALDQLVPEDVSEDENEAIALLEQEDQLKQTSTLHEQRIDAVLDALKRSGATRVIDLGCGEGKLLRELLKEKQFTQILGMDVSHRILEKVHDRLKLDRMPEKQSERLTLIHGSLTYRDKRLEGYDAAAVVEVIEHLDLTRLKAFERVVFEKAKPVTVVITTPNREYNVLFETLPAGKLRHGDHRFEWTRPEFQTWADAVALTNGYTVSYSTVGPVDVKYGSPSQMAVFVKIK